MIWSHSGGCLEGESEWPWVAAHMPLAFCCTLRAAYCPHLPGDAFPASGGCLSCTGGNPECWRTELVAMDLLLRNRDIWSILRLVLLYSQRSSEGKLWLLVVEICLLMFIALFLTPSHASIPLLDFPRITSWINCMQPNLHFRKFLEEPKDKSFHSKSDMNDNLHIVQGLLSLQFGSKPANKSAKDTHQVRIQAGESLVPLWTVALELGTCQARSADSLPSIPVSWRRGLLEI